METLISDFYYILHLSLALFVPVKRYKTSNFPKWCSPELRSYITEKKIVHKSYKETKGINEYIKCSDVRELCKNLTNECYKNYLTINPKLFWKFINYKAKL